MTQARWKNLSTCSHGVESTDRSFHSHAMAKMSFLVLPVLAAMSQPSLADPDWMLERVGPNLSSLETCLSSASGDTLEGTVSTIADCAANRALSSMLGDTMHSAESHGQALIGDHFHIDNRLAVSTGDGGLRGDLDAVFPIRSFSSSAPEGETGQVLFMQSGVTRWTDNRGFRRNDIRQGMVFRFASLNRPESGVFGIWAFTQKNVERGHERFVTGLDYAGRWGTGSLNYFIPSTGWRPGRSGYEERALEGMELGLRIDASDTITLDAATGRWESADGSGDLTTRARIGLEWRPHPWLMLRSAWESAQSNDETMANDETMDVRVEVAVPFGRGGHERPRWRGMGRRVGGSERNASDFWRSVDSVGQIEVAERAMPNVNSDSTTRQATVRFLQDRVDTGGTVRMEVEVSSPASTDLRFEVRLVPGAGDNPAVPGEDFVDEPTEIVIPKGRTSAVAFFRLLGNPSLRMARSLGVSITEIV